MFQSRFWTAARNALLKVAAFWVLVLAAYLALGRQFFPYIDRIQPEIEVWLSGQLGTPVTIGELHGEWVRFNPVVHLSDVTLGDDIRVAQMTLAPGIYESISRGGLSFIRFELTDFQAELIETREGWSLQGLSGSGGRVELSELLALLQRQQEVNFVNTRLAVRPLELPRFELILHDGQLAGYGSENFLVARASIRANQIDVPIELQLETSQIQNTKNRLYLRHGTIDLSPWLQEVADGIGRAEMAGEYWLNLDGSQWRDLTVRLTTESLTYAGTYDVIELNGAHFEGYVERRENGIETWLNLSDYQIGDREFETTQAKLDYRADRLKVEWDSLPADLVGAFLALDDPNGFWRNLAPQGFVEQGVMTMTGGNAESLKLSAQIDDLRFQAHKGVPGLQQLSGNIRVEGSRGRLQATSPNAQLHLPGLYAEPFDSEVTAAELEWSSAPGQGLFARGAGEVILKSGRSAVDGRTGTPQSVQVNWSSISPFLVNRQAGREALVDVQLTAQDVSYPWALALADNANVAESTLSWMSNRIEQARFPLVHLNYLSAVDVNGRNRSQFFLESEVQQGQVRFLDDWASAFNLNGQLSLDRQGLAVSGQAGEYPGFLISDYHLNLPFATNVLSLDLALSADASDTLGFLQRGPLSSNLNGLLDTWTAQGPLSGNLQLSVPLSAPEDFQVAIESRLEGVSADLGNLDLTLTEIAGPLSFNLEQGLQSQGLQLKHDGLVQRVGFQAPLGGDGAQLDLTVTGETAIRYWGERFSDAYLTDNPAIVSHDTTVEVNNGRTLIRSKSDLSTMALDFPEPMNKSAGMDWPLSLEVVLDERNWTMIKASADERLQSYFELDQNRAIRRGTVAYQRPLNVRGDEGVYFDIRSDNLDASAWWQAIQQTRELYQQSNADDAQVSFEALIQAVDIRSDRLSYLAQDWGNAHLTLLRNDDAWLTEFDANEGQGQVLIPHDDAELFVDVDWLNLTTEPSTVAFEDELDPLKAFRPTDVPPMQVQINKLIWNQRDLGSWRGEVQRQDSAMVVQNVTGEMTGAELTGQLVWSFSDGEHLSRYTGRVAVGDIQQVLNTWGYAPVLSSTSGWFDMAIDWQGSPAFFDFKRIRGGIDLRLNRGSIVQIDDYEGLKLIGLLNFTRVIQRLALDFSDLLQSGITFDMVEGELIFDRGFARVGEKLIIDGSATKFKFSGDADLLADEVDIDMVFTVPLSSTFPLVALLAGVSPQAAAAIYVTERVFNNELERLSSARMHITGSFNDPVTRFYRVFDNNLGEDGPSVTDRVNQVVPDGVVTP